jgi:hypothetical protein
MANNVFILGAGASARAGAPLMNGFIPAAQQLKRDKQLDPEDETAFELVLKARTQLQPVFSKSRLDLDNVEELFGAFEMATLLGRLGNLTEAEIDRLPTSMVRLITSTIEKNVVFPTKGQPFSDTSQRVFPPPPYPTLVDVIRQLLKRGESVAVISFNYDLALDYALHFSGVPVEYCLAQDLKPGTLHVMKLHGSLNWGRCPKCNTVVPWHLSEFLGKYRWGYDLPPTVRLDISVKLPSLVHCANVPLESCAVIVPPTWNKGKYHDDLSLVWRAAAVHLSEAERILIIGYSLPRTDEFFKYFYALGSVGPSIPTDFCIINPDAEVAGRFRDILGPMAAGPNCFRAIQAKFEDAMGTIAAQLNL